MRWLCIFFPCRWLHLFNAYHYLNGECGIYQCARCKTISTGALR